MKIAILGTSNSVSGENGYIKSLREQHQIIQLSVGRVPFFYHIKTILTNIELIESCDVLIIDHYINDINFYLDRLGSSYRGYCLDFYKILGAINTNVINLFFPVKNIYRHKHYKYFTELLVLSEKHNISVLNLNKLECQDFIFKDEIHITHHASYLFGLWFSELLSSSLFSETVKKGVILNCPFKVNVLTDNLKTEDNVDLFSNSLISIKFLEIKSDITVNVSNDYKLLSVGFVNLKSGVGCSGLAINNIKVGLEGIGYYHEAIDFELYGKLKLSSLKTNQNIRNLFDRGDNKLIEPYSMLTELLFFDKSSGLKTIQEIRSPCTFDLSKLHFMFDKLLMPMSKKISNNTIDRLRDLAIENEANDLEFSHDIMSILNFLRPSGHFINKKLFQYSSLNKNKS
ncbi:hypothetical protein [Psychromonas sp. KJ10-2]|uniref:hypothetical protein n=1 Tax=Psychromonas sp. KJ10-2 TaxID=3391822 RepID=UPI0039B5FC4F